MRGRRRGHARSSLALRVFRFEEYQHQHVHKSPPQKCSGASAIVCGVWVFEHIFVCASAPSLHLHQSFGYARATQHSIYCMLCNYMFLLNLVRSRTQKTVRANTNLIMKLACVFRSRMCVFFRFIISESDVFGARALYIIRKFNH